MAGRRLALLAATLLLLAAGAEMATRLLTDTMPPLRENDPVLGQRHIRCFQQMVYVPEARRSIWLHFNRVGFRGPDRPFAKPEGVRRIAVLGDSMIASLAVNEEDTMVCRLQRMLNRPDSATQWEVLNFGLAGSSPGQELVVYRELASRFDPDVVLCAYFVGNDLADNCRRLSKRPRIYFDVDEAGKLVQLPFSGHRAYASQFLNRYSRFYVWQKNAYRNLRHKIIEKTGGISAGHWVYCRRESTDLTHAWRLSGEIAKAFHQEAIRRGSRFALILIPSGWQVYDDCFRRVVERAGALAGHLDPGYPDERLGALCREAGVPFLSMYADFRQAAPSASAEVEEERLFHDGVGHFNEKGNELAARAVYRFLTRGDPLRLAALPTARQRCSRSGRLRSLTPGIERCSEANRPLVGNPIGR